MILRFSRHLVLVVQVATALALALVCSSTHAASRVPPAPAPTKSAAISTGRTETVPVPMAFAYRDRVADSAFALGAQSVGKSAKTLIFWSGSATDSEADARGACALVMRGADVLLAMTETDAVARLAAKKTQARHRLAR